MEPLHVLVRSEFDLLYKLGVKFANQTLQMIFLYVLKTPDSDSYSAHVIKPKSGLQLEDKIDAR